MLLLALPWVFDMDVKCVSVLGGWRTATVDGKEFGPTFNKIQDLWAWQRNKRFSPDDSCIWSGEINDKMNNLNC